MNVELTPTARPHPAADAAPGLRWAPYIVALAIALPLAHFVRGLPIQVSDSFGNMQQLSASWSELLEAQFTQKGFLRPFLWAGLKLVYDASGGNYTAWFRGTHVVQVVFLTLLFAAAVRPVSWREVACLPFAFAVLFGMHTFSGTVLEAFPINTFMTLLILSLAAVAIALGRYRWWNDPLAAALFVIGALTVETGLLLWVIFVGAALVGARGVSRPGLAVLTALLGAYFYVRFGLLDVGSPDLLERSSGFGLRVLDPPELVARFGENPLPFYLYNIGASLLTVLFSEPTSGVFYVVRAATEGALGTPLIVNAVASLGVVALIARFAWTRRREWHSRRFDRDDRLVLVFAMVLVANAVISYPYTKDTTMSIAGALLAAAAFAAVRHLVRSIPAAMSRQRLGLAMIALLVVSAAWSLRTVNLFAQLRHRAVGERIDWAYIESDIADGHVSAATPAARALLDQLQREAIVEHPAPLPLELPFYGVMAE